MSSLPVWSASWTDDKAWRSALGLLWALVIPGLPLLVWSALEPSSAWVMNLSSMVGVFLYLPYALIILLALVVRLLVGGEPHKASLFLDCGARSASTYREAAEWSVEASFDQTPPRSMTFALEVFEGFAREPLDEEDPFERWFRIVLLLKATEPIVLLERLPARVSRQALEWLCERSQTRPAPGSEPI